MELFSHPVLLQFCLCVIHRISYSISFQLGVIYSLQMMYVYTHDCIYEYGILTIR